MTTLYEVLGVRPDATTEEIKQAFRRKALECHPDVGANRGGSHKEFHRVTEAYEVSTTMRENFSYACILACPGEPLLRGSCAVEE
jgi:DnaJ-class molecular chaperone